MYDIVCVKLGMVNGTMSCERDQKYDNVRYHECESKNRT